VPTRLNAILLIPVLVALVFGGFKVHSDISAWQDAKKAQRTAELVEAAANYGNALIDERDRTAEPLLEGHKNDSAVRKARTATDRAAREFKTAASHLPENPGLKRRLAAFEKVEPRLGVVRASAYSDDLDGVETEEAYVTIQHPLMEFANELGLGTGNVTSYGRTVYAISLAKAAGSLQRSLGTHLIVKPGPSRKDKKDQLTALASYHYLERIALGEYTSGGRPEDVRLLKKERAKAEAAGRKQAQAAKDAAAAKDEKFVTPPSMGAMVTAIGSGASERELKAKGITSESYFATATGTFDAYRAIESQLVHNAVVETAQIASDARRNALVNSAIVLFALLIAFVVAGRMARSMSQSMRSLRTAAFDVAQQRLPTLVDQLSRTEPARVDTRVQPIPITSKDEIGEVARAFDQVHREAVRLAAEQALLRGNVNAIFTNLSRRNQGLIERQLELVSEMENSEADPDQLEKLFRMDHLSTRMRRNGENLLVLAGEEPGRRWTEPVPLVDILRAASSEVEHYDRIEVSGVPETEIHGQVVNDLVHLLAELLENAASFSSPHSKVRVTATRLPDGRMMIEIHDKGIGLTAEDFADINHKLANPPTVDAAVSQRMGLFVVGRLAGRHGIRVQLRPSGEQAGTTSLVMLPDAITHGGGGGESPEEDFTVSRIVPEHPRGPSTAAEAHSAVEQGYDDSRLDTAGSSTSLAPLGRPRLREERRAALEAPQAQQGRQDPQSQQPQLPPYGGDQGYGSGQGYEGPDPQGYELDRGYGTGQAYESREPYQQTGEIAAQQYSGGGYGGYGSGHDTSVAGTGAWDQQQLQPQPPGQQGQYTPHQPEAESAPGVPPGEAERVGFDSPDPLASSYRATTDAGLPRRDPVRGQQDRGPEGQHQALGEGNRGRHARTGTWAGQPSQEETGAHQWNANDQRWNQAGQLRTPQSGGVTSSGLPRRVPRANLVAGAAEDSSRSGPAVSRAPEDVRGRLSNLHRGVRRGRTAGDGNQNDRQGFGLGSTYDQER
jgi:signal transduction histidine kinase